jgi:type II secretory pathway component PulJ
VSGDIENGAALPRVVLPLARLRQRRGTFERDRAQLAERTRGDDLTCTLEHAFETDLEGNAQDDARSVAFALHLARVGHA